MLEYFALFLVFFVFLVVFYGIIVIHDIPYEIAVHRNHPQQDAIHVAGWISLFTLGAIWPFLWIWATLNRDAIHGKDLSSNKEIDALTTQVDSLKVEFNELKQQLNKED
ncbi:DUF3302 domain-containing protein [Thalassotalea psychrophila]|uniref:DUF3302 domain-containing protein n=1 Tax=Thalassotalea psychrophila TaxID=3065647 RepID=A0ABY9TYY5_9GAMM|nr:DUF3302 domain-containing protein [Colwelliaceae bacterium SQ149]